MLTQHSLNPATAPLQASATSLLSLSSRTPSGLQPAARSRRQKKARVIHTQTTGDGLPSCDAAARMHWLELAMEMQKQKYFNTLIEREPREVSYLLEGGKSQLRPRLSHGSNWPQRKEFRAWPHALCCKLEQVSIRRCYRMLHTRAMVIQFDDSATSSALLLTHHACSPNASSRTATNASSDNSPTDPDHSIHTCCLVKQVRHSRRFLETRT